MWPSWGKSHSRDWSRSTREGGHQSGQNVSVDRPPFQPHFEENDPSTEFPPNRNVMPLGYAASAF